MLDRTASAEIQTLLLQRMAAQDRQALGEFYDQLGAVLFAAAFRILGDRLDAEDVIQEVFVQIWTKAGSFDRRLGTPFHWAMTMTRNRCIDLLRARQRRRAVLDDPGDDEARPEPAAPEATLDDALSRDEAGVVRTAVAGLPTEQRQALELAFFSGLSHHEIATRLNEPLGTVKARIRRGLLKLRESLEGYV